MNKIAKAVAGLAAPVCEKHGCELWDVEYVKEAGTRYLRVFIDRPDGVSIEHCEAVSRELDPILDEDEDLIPDSYIFEVSSAGAERPLRRPSDFERFRGSLIEVRLYKARDGKKEFIGYLRGSDSSSGDIEIDIEGEILKFEKDGIANVRLRIG
ncbi:MAG: ribosome maturation factor RimP [Oscillospiraceae bacterium]|nr:ribosome maturation factor RimP [Oscillospiraceae bacterium]